MKSFKKYINCSLCGRGCGVNREKGEIGFCGMGSEIVCARASLHKWEEPLISGKRGSGAIFFSGCSLKCKFCQNRDISFSGFGEKISIDEMAKIMLKLKDAGAHNINLVTGTHFVPSIIEAVKTAKSSGLDIPIVYNTASYESLDAVKMLKDVVDIYLPDLKYYTKKLAKELSFSEDYPDVAKANIEEMIKQQPKAVIENGIMKKGVIVRVLLLPGHVADAKLTVNYLYSTYGDSIYISLMSQYTPMPNMEGALARKVTREEYSELVDYALKKGIKNAFIQENGCASELYIPEFNLYGIK